MGHDTADTHGAWTHEDKRQVVQAGLERERELAAEPAHVRRAKLAAGLIALALASPVLIGAAITADIWGRVR